MGSKRLFQIQRYLPELYQLEALIEANSKVLKAKELCWVEQQGHQLPVWGLQLGSDDPQAPALGLIGGVHGVERIGSQIILSYLRTLLAQLRWDPMMQQQLQSFRLFVVPIVNPAGMWNNSRCNGNGVDLMRNAPVEGQGKIPFLLGGHRISPRLPWYRGKRHAPMQPELQALHDFTLEQHGARPFTLLMDCHSGFGFQDRIWFPYAGSQAPFDDLASVFRLYRLFQSVYHAHTFYKFEPQAHSYTTHGDLWDMLYDEVRVNREGQVLLPLTLEMGSWLWVKKNPRQLFSYAKLFNPTVPHRYSRILRRHYPLFDFLQSATRNWQHWLPTKPAKRRKYTRTALKHWYKDS